MKKVTVTEETVEEVERPVVVQPVVVVEKRSWWLKNHGLRSSSRPSRSSRGPGERRRRGLAAPTSRRGD
jgi:hypothetical protein